MKRSVTIPGRREMALCAVVGPTRVGMRRDEKSPVREYDEDWNKSGEIDPDPDRHSGSFLRSLSVVVESALRRIPPIPCSRAPHRELIVVVVELAGGGGG